MRIERSMTSNLKGVSDDLHHIRSHQSVASSHDRGHVCPQVRREDATRLPSPGREFCKIPGRLAGYGHRRGPAPLSGSPDRDRRAGAEHEQLGGRIALFLHGHARPRQPRSPAHARALSTPAAAGAEPRRGRSIDRGRTRPWPQVQGGAERCLRCRAARVRSGRTEGRRYRQLAPADPGRAGQGPQGSSRDALAAVACRAARVVAAVPVAGLAVPGARGVSADHDAAAQPGLPHGG